MKKIFTPLCFLLMVCAIPAAGQLNVELLGHLTYPVNLSNLTGWSDGVGHEYAIVGTEDGTSIVDITDPTTPTEVQFVDGNNSIWREVRTWSHYAYVVTEAGGGLLCIDLSGLPGSVTYNFSDGGVGINTGHTVFCDENGIVHVFGSNVGAGGDQMLDANIDPMDPVSVGEVDTWYIHDGFVRGDTLCAANIYNGWFSVWDISDKTSPVLMAQQLTPGAFTHNVWLNPDNHYIYTTDEETNATVASYDVSDLTDIKALDEFQANPGTNSIPHNVMWKNDFLVTAYYRDGVIITDAHYPDNLIKTGWYDTSPLSGDGYNGCWGSWPYLPSGNIIASDMEEGLYVLGPTYVQACYLEGTITDATTGAPVFGGTVSFTAVGATDATSDLSGDYHTGIYDAGAYDVTFSKAGYLSQTIPAVALTNGVVTTLDVELVPLAAFTVTGQVIDAGTGLGIASADVQFQNAIYNFHTLTDASGNFTITGMYPDAYTIYAGHWGHITNSMTDDVAPGDTYTIILNKGYYDDFIFDNNWTASGTAPTGHWERGVPFGTFNGTDASNPGNDVDDDYGDMAFVTGNLDDAAAGTDDVDAGTSILISPEMDLSSYTDPVLTYDRWFYNGGGTGTPNDTLRVFVSNGTTEVQIDAIHAPSPDFSTWKPMEFHIADYVPITSTMHIRVRTADQSATGHLVEGGLDKFYVYDDVTAAPTAAFTAENKTGCAPLTVSFVDNSVGATSWAWLFPGGAPSSSSLQNPSVVYDSPGLYDVTLTATNIIGSDETTTAGFVSVEACNAIDETTAAAFMHISPNPFTAFTTISINQEMLADEIAVTDITGREITRISMNGSTAVTLSGQGLPAGVYEIRAYSKGSEIGTLQVIKSE